MSKVSDRAKGLELAQDALVARATDHRRELTPLELIAYEELERQKVAAERTGAIAKRWAARVLGQSLRRRQ